MNILVLFVWIVAIAAFAWLAWWVLSQFSPPAPVGKLAYVAIVVIAVIAIIWLLLKATGVNMNANFGGPITWSVPTVTEKGILSITFPALYVMDRG